MAIPSYTNCIVTCIWADGENRTPAILFTCNPKFRQDKMNTNRQKQLKRYLNDVMEEYGITEDRVVYIGDIQRGSKTYAYECPLLLHLFFANYKLPYHLCRIMSYQGKAFREEESSVLENIGFSEVMSYPPSIHQYLSPNDNKLHGVAKAKWKWNKQDKKNDVANSLFFLNALDNVKKENISQWFRTNFMLDVETPTTLDVLKNMKANNTNREQYHEKCKKQYEAFCKKNMSRPRVDSIEESEDDKPEKGGPCAK